MANIFIIHGISGHPEENWFPWLKKELETLGHQVFVPQFPTPENQTLTNWLQKLQQYQQFITPETIFIGHSLGAPFILNILEKHQAKAAILVAGFISKNHNQFDESTKTFTQKSFDWPKITTNCKNFTIIQSDNDPYVKPEKGEEIAKHLDTKVITIKDAGHFNEAAGYTTFNQLLETLKSFLT